MGSMGSVTARLTLDSTQFDAALDKSTEKLSASARTRQKASEAAARVEALNARLAGEAVSASTLKIIEARKAEAAATKDVTLAKQLLSSKNANEEAATNTLAAALQRQASARKALSQAIAEQNAETSAATAVSLSASMQAAAAIETAGHASVSQMQATSAAIRSFEGNPGIRAVERFLTTIPGVGAALQVAFPVVGAVALGSVLVDLAAKAYRAAENIYGLKDAIEKLNQMEIRVQKAVGTDADEIERNVEDILQRTYGRAAANRQRQQYQSAKPIDLSDYFYSDAVKGLPDDIKGNYETLYKSIAPQDLPDRLAKIRKEVTDLTSALRDAKDPSSFGMIPTSVGGLDLSNTRDPVAALTARLTLARQISDQLQSKSDLRASGLQALSVDAQKDAEEEATQQQERAARLTAQQRRQREEQLRAQMEAAEEQLDALKADHELQQGEEYVFWQRMQQTAAQGSALWLAIQKKMAPAFQEWMRQLDEGAKRIEERNAKYAAMIREWDEVAGRGLDEIDKAAAAHADAQRRIDDILEKNALSVEKLRIAEGMRSGQITKMAAAQQLAAATARSYADELARLERQLKALQDYQGADKQEKIDSTNEKIAATQGQLAEANLQVGYAAGGQPGSAIVGLIDAFDRMAQAANRLDDIIGSLADSIENGLNQQFVRALSGQRTDFSNTAAGFFRQASGSALKYGEGKLLGSLGFGGGGKPTGTPGDPYYIRNADGAPGGAGGSSSVQHAAATGFKGFLQKIFGLNSGNGGSTADAGSDADDADMSGFDMSAFDTIPFMAQGGLLTANSMAWVGERGPELFMPSTSGTIVPNSKLRGGNVTHHHHHINIDARGATDPAAVNRQIMRAVPHIVGASVAAVRDYQRRIPSSKR